MFLWTLGLWFLITIIINIIFSRWQVFGTISRAILLNKLLKFESKVSPCLTGPLCLFYSELCHKNNHFIIIILWNSLATITRATTKGQQIPLHLPVSMLYPVVIDHLLFLKFEICKFWFVSNIIIQIQIIWIFLLNTSWKREKAQEFHKSNIDIN